ncbi:N-acylsphingosine amidohydrolase [Thecamonas trahens ATCC 50062]|uniref:N-acylsphingosine amidohydrolase n=1 Tax=Thecamonas trahens ATCC 50062 TaxID=461836 RepID=A0A0L0DLZ8_THETB|nr:N-acylsphingosine amidohydrolase [Thecamonas trahens ATCC 50062]KNC52418.1 N-acylsphingosine amidohydrolase [Thecamonas trahens ATCC 50062]|eukprot:XP_013755460.1 N-acylsphingosine amidohydrolase [Thecamonas trahens ATCC 50062]
MARVSIVMVVAVACMSLAGLCSGMAVDVERSLAASRAQAMLASPAFQADLTAVELAMSSPRPADSADYARAVAEGHHLPCALCSIAFNEIFALMMENDTVAFIQDELNKDFCPRMPASLQAPCKLLVASLPAIFDDIGDKVSIANTCVKLDFCKQPWADDHPETMDIPSYTIDLDAAPENRFAQVCANKTFIHELTDMFDWIAAGLEDGGKRIVEFGNTINKFLPAEYSGELAGCAKALDIDAGWLAFVQVAYTASDACTSMILATPDSQSVIHGRNLDFWSGLSFAGTLKNCTFYGTFTKGGKTAYEITMIGGMFGSLTGVVPGGHASTVNTRFVPGGLWAYVEMIVNDIIQHDSTLVLFATRNALAAGYSWADAVKYLSSVRLPSDVYFTISGVSKNEGIIVARAADSVFNTTALDVDSGKWWVGVTNYPWGPGAPPNGSPWFDQRYIPLMDHLEHLGHANVNMDAAWDVLSIKPTFNLQTVTSNVIVAANGTLHSASRWCPWPCAQ